MQYLSHLLCRQVILLWLEREREEQDGEELIFEIDIFTPVVFPNQQPVIIDGVTLVPVRPVFEALGFEVGWNAESQTVKINFFDIWDNRFDIFIGIGDDYFIVSDGDPSGVGEGHLSVPAQIINNSTMIPLRPILEYFNYGVRWNAETRTIYIYDIEYMNLFN